MYFKTYHNCIKKKNKQTKKTVLLALKQLELIAFFGRGRGEWEVGQTFTVAIKFHFDLQHIFTNAYPFGN